VFDPTRLLGAREGIEPPFAARRSGVIRELNVILVERRRPVAGADSGGGG
jgi:hypothetical protein